MKLLVIVLCLLSERFLLHGGSQHRFRLFKAYGNYISPRLPKTSFIASSWFLLFLILFPWIIGIGLAFYCFENLLFGFAGFLFNLIIFFVCIGPENPFYPVRSSAAKDECDTEVERYLTEVNGAMFAALFWYIALGPLAVLTYRLVSLSQHQQSVGHQATLLTDIFDWIPARMTVLLYLLVGNFQAGVQHFAQSFFLAPDKNQSMLSSCGMKALRCRENKPVTLTHAEGLVEHAVIVLLLLLACFTLVAWM